MPPTMYRARSGTELIDAGFRLVTSNYIPFVTIAAIGYAPSFAVPLLMRSGTGMVTGMTGISLGIVVILLAIVGFITAIMANGALIQATSDAYAGRAINVEASLRAGRQAFRSLANVNIGTGVLVMLGFMLFIVPGIILLARFFVVSAVVMLEGGKEIRPVLERSSKLCEDTKLRILGFLCVLAIVYVIAIATVGVITGMTKNAVLGVILMLVVKTFVWPLYHAFVTLQYYDARIRKEGYDVELLAGTMTPPTVQPPTTA